MEDDRKMPAGDASSESKQQSPEEKRAAYLREKLHGTDRIEALRSRLYERGATDQRRERHSLRPNGIERTTPSVPTALEFPQEKRKEASDKRSISGLIDRMGASKDSETKTEEPQGSFHDTSMPKKKSHSYRLKILLVGFIFLLFSAGISILFVLYGNNTISGENITIDVSGPFAIGGGEEIPLQIAIANQNAVPIESATLIIEYPPGTQSATDVGRELFSERQQLNNINAGEVVNVPVKAILFGEENDEKIIAVSVEYRVRGSNATFYKEAEPLRLKISSSPVVLDIDSVESISSGQEVELTLRVRSNSPTPLTDILVKGTYPFGFDFSDSSPDTISGQDTWLIESLEPEAEHEIVIKGIVVGKQNEDRVFTFSVGVPNAGDRFSLASVFTTITQEISLEDPFLGAIVTINGSASETVAIESNESTDVSITFTNSLEDTIYDGVVEAALSGNALNEVEIRTSQGFYDSTKNIVRWDSVDVGNLEEIAPGRSVTLTFTMDPAHDVGRTPEIGLDVTVKGRRVYENRVPQELTNTISRKIKIASDIQLRASALYSEGPFINTGPTPPVAEEVTQYTLLLSADNGSNDVTGAEVTAVLPQYVTWLDLVTPGDDVTYDAITRVMTWNIGDMDSSSHEEAWVQVSFLPSLSQVGKEPVILETQRFKATDRFTGTIVREDSRALTTELIDDPDTSTRDGKVRNN